MSRFVDKPDTPASHIGRIADSVGMTNAELSRRLFGEPLWQKGIASGQDGLESGDSVVLLLNRDEWYRGVPDEKKGWRSSPNKIGPDRPPQFLLYELESQGEDEPGNYRVYWNPNDFVEENTFLKDHHRKRRTPWRVWQDEVTAPRRMSASNLEALAFHSESEVNPSDLLCPLRRAWKREVTSGDQPHLIEVIAERLKVDVEDHFFDLWGGALSWRAHNDFAEFPRTDGLQVLRVQQHVHWFINVLRG